jgi:hypothetical protein
MTNQQILEKAIQKAIDNGWQVPRSLSFMSNKEFLYYLDDVTNPTTLKWLKFKCNELLFNHDFAKALWGEETSIAISGGTMFAWAYHLQQMVIADDPIKYLGENI